MSDECGFIQILFPKGAYELESSNNKIHRIIIEEERYFEAIYPFTIKPNFLTLGSFKEKSSQGPINSFLPDDSRSDFSGFNATTLYQEYNLSPNPVDILSFDNYSLGCDVAQGVIY